MIISGANLSNDYFTSRIDRYVLFENCPELINFYEEFIFFFFLSIDFSLYSHVIVLILQILEKYIVLVIISVFTFIVVSSKKKHQELRDGIMDLLKTGGSQPSTKQDGDVMIYPTFQQEALNLVVDYSAFKDILHTSSKFPGVNLYLTSGYMNFPAEIGDALANYPNEMNYLFAAPQANSFFHDPGFASVIPALYNIVYFTVFLMIINSYNVNSSISVMIRKQMLICKDYS